MSKLLTETAVAVKFRWLKFYILHCTTIHSHTAIKTDLLCISLLYMYKLYTYMYVCVQSDAYHKTYCFFQLLVLDNR